MTSALFWFFDRYPYCNNNRWILIILYLHRSFVRSLNSVLRPTTTRSAILSGRTPSATRTQRNEDSNISRILTLTSLSRFRLRFSTEHSLTQSQVVVCNFSYSTLRFASGRCSYVPRQISIFPCGADLTYTASAHGHSRLR